MLIQKQGLILQNKIFFKNMSENIIFTQIHINVIFVCKDNKIVRDKF